MHSKTWPGKNNIIECILILIFLRKLNLNIIIMLMLAILAQNLRQ